MTLQAIEIFHDVEEGDVEFLSELERAATRFEWIPEDRLAEISNLPEQDVEYRLDRLDKFELIEKGIPKYEGYRILPAGYDILAIKKLVKDDVLEAFGRVRGLGKEADIYDALTPDEERVAAKFNRLGLSFTNLKKKRPYIPKHGWIDASKDSAKREFEALGKLHPKVEVPKPIAYNRHVLVMGFIAGEELVDVEDIDFPEPVLEEIFRNVNESYQAGIIHGDLSEYNIIIKPNGEIMIIDWPQWEPITHPRADELLERDIKNVLGFFRRKFGVEKKFEKVLKNIKG
ncbi:hypothetical protein AKJ57_06020 [candidate division MSBL1 archaeon SCGC-AAA259A05]|uniref:non-specific serine/threonine protein kinase n=1 Tax=candidate division MSBL1 archaeon SCGC-AAA259A05 TaxID=1698259 RepID=A0A133U474_9EURY|nr:hypothetical protein AKJ57_06020 [candidate division MSBL1 archaeon SCGC-AAA259A05]